VHCTVLSAPRKRLPKTRGVAGLRHPVPRPRRDESGRITEKGAVTVWFNGKKVQDNTEFGEPNSTFHPFRFGNTPYLDKIRDQQKKTMTGPVFLQDHGNPVKFRNVWVLPADDHAFVYEPGEK